MEKNNNSSFFLEYNLIKEVVGINFFIPNVPPKLYSISAIIVGYILIDDLTANEQNALGNWLMLTAQVLCTNAFYVQVQQERNQMKNTNMSSEDNIKILSKMADAINKTINDLKNNNL